jgi:hypothetical protein
MWSFGSNDSTSTWYLLVAVPQTSQMSITAPTITGTGFSISSTSSAFFTSSSSGGIQDLFSQTNGNGNESLNASNMFGSLEQAAFGSTPADFDVLLYTVTGAFSGSTAYSFTASPGLIAGTFLAANGTDTKGAALATPFTTAGLVPDGGMTLMLLGGALVGLEALRRRVRA